MKPFIIIFLITITVLVFNCDENISASPDKPLFSTTLNGKVILENQTEYSNALVYIDSLYRGISTDSNGNYSITFSEDDSILTGEFKLIYFLNDYDMDTARIALIKGKIKLDSLDVDPEGNIDTKLLKQIVRIEGWTDKTEYKIGEKVYFTARVTNLSHRGIHLFISSFAGPLSSFIVLYNDKYTGFTLGGAQDPLSSEYNSLLQPGEYYEGSSYGEIFEYKPLIPDEYIVCTQFLVDNRSLNHFESKFYSFAVEKWWKICRGVSPKLDFFPNKYKFPHIRIIQN